MEKEPCCYKLQLQVCNKNYPESLHEICSSKIDHLFKISSPSSDIPRGGNRFLRKLLETSGGLEADLGKIQEYYTDYGIEVNVI